MTRGKIIGWAHSVFGRHLTSGIEDLIGPVADTALKHADVEASDVDGIFVGIMNNGFSTQDFSAALAGMANPRLAEVPAVRLENACASGSAAIHAALDFIEAGRGRIALVIGAEKMTAVPTAAAGQILLGASYVAEEVGVPGGFAGIFARIAHTYFERYGNRSRDLAMIAAKNHRNGTANPFAHMRRDLGFEFCNAVSDANPLIAPPLRRTDCSMVSDGAAALVIADADVATTSCRRIAFRARSHANDVLALSRRDPLAFDGARRAWRVALDEAKLDLSDLSLVETHDCFTIAELIEYEAMGLAVPGQGNRIVQSGEAEKDGKLPINPSGGLKAKGHPVGATGVSMHVLAAMQLMQEAGAMQVANRGLAGVFNMGGAAVANYVSIVEREL